MKSKSLFSKWFSSLHGVFFPRRPNPRVAMLTLCVGERYAKAMQSGLRSKEECARAQGIDFILGREDVLDTSRPPSWSKIGLIKKYLPDYDYVFFSDADVVIINPEIRLADIIRNHMGCADFMLTRDAANNLNMGNFFVRRCPWSLDFMDRIYAQTEFIEHPWWENKAFIHLYENDPSVRDHVQVITDARLFNTYIDPKDPFNLDHFPANDFLIHLAGFPWEGYSIDELEKVMNFCYDHRVPFFQ